MLALSDTSVDERMTVGAAAPIGLVGDIGGTYARFALVAVGGDRPQLIAPRRYLCAEFASADQAAAAYLAEVSETTRPTSAVLAVAGPIVDGTIAFTNTDWRISEAAFSDAMQLTSTRLVNDYAALAFAAPLLGPGETMPIGDDRPGRADGVLAIMGAGTGFGVSVLVRDGGLQSILTTEGGHIALAPADELEVEVWRILMRRYGRVSVERVLSGPGLLDLYRALAEIRGGKADAPTPGDVTRLAEAEDTLALETVNRFCAILGGVAGDFALAYGALGGVYLAGGVTEHLAATLQNGGFRTRFEQKGRFETYLSSIPTRIILHPHEVAMIGAAVALNPA